MWQSSGQPELHVSCQDTIQPKIRIEMQSMSTSAGTCFHLKKEEDNNDPTDIVSRSSLDAAIKLCVSHSRRTLGSTHASTPPTPRFHPT
jgi:hypothetical protein